MHEQVHPPRTGAISTFLSALAKKVSAALATSGITLELRAPRAGVPSPKNGRRRWILLEKPLWGFAAAFAIGLVVLLGGPGSAARAASSSCPNGTTLNVVAHEDDDLLFLSPDLLHDVQSNRCVVTVFVTAGDDGQASDYWQGREAGSEAAYASMAGVADSWTTSDAGIVDHPIRVRTLNGDPNISLVFMRLPDGFDGGGFARYGYQSLQELWGGTLSQITADDSTTSYSKSDLISTLTALMNEYQPNTIRMQDYNGVYGDGDHSDHYASAHFAYSAQQSYSTTHTVVGYLGYGVTYYPQNVFGSDLTQKQAAFYAYAAHDPNSCDSDEACSGSAYATWLQRSFVLGTPSANAGPNRTVPTGAEVRLDGSSSYNPDGGHLIYTWSQIDGPGVSLDTPAAVSTTLTAPSTAATLDFRLTVTNSDSGLSSSDTVTVTVFMPGAGVRNVATSATATASSQTTSPNQTASKAIDGYPDGYPGDPTHEWASQGEKAGAWLNLHWSSAQTLDHVVLYDRPNPNDQITGATLTFDGGNPVSVPTLPNDGSPLTVSFPAISVTNLKLTINSVSATTGNIGLAEIEAWTAPSAGGDHTPVANAGPDQTVNKGAAVQLDGSASYDPDTGDTVSYSWAQTLGPAVTLSSTTAVQPTFTAPASGSTTLGFELTVSDGQLSSVSDVTITVADRAPVADAGSDQTVNTNAAVYLDGSSSSDPDSGDTFSYAWTQTYGTPVTLTGAGTANPSFTAPSSAGLLVFRLTANDGELSGTATVSVTVVAPGGKVQNVALLATATASSQDVANGQTAAKAIDGYTDGYPAAPTHEWATYLQDQQWPYGEGAGAWLKLNWGTTAHTLDHVVLYDRPNSNDQVTGGTLTFSDHTSVDVPELPNDGSPLTVSFPAVSTTSLLFTVTSVSESTGAVGLAEIQAWTVANRAPVANAGPDQTGVHTKSTVQLDGSASSDPDTDPLGYSWTQIGGPSVTSPISTRPSRPSPHRRARPR